MIAKIFNESEESLILSFALVSNVSMTSYYHNGDLN